MPLKRCGNNGWKWGDSGHCYTGPNGKKQAIKQGIAIEGPDKFKSIAKDDWDINPLELDIALAEHRAGYNVPRVD